MAIGVRPQLLDILYMKELWCSTASESLERSDAFRSEQNATTFFFFTFQETLLLNIEKKTSEN